MSSTTPTNGNDTLDGDVNAPDLIEAQDGDDLVRGNGAGTDADTLLGEGGNDTLVTTLSGGAYVDGGAGDDLIEAGAPGPETGIGGAGDDTLIGGFGIDYLTGDDFDLFGAPGNTVAGNDLIAGGEGDDALSGGPGNDSIDGGDGQDQIYGGEGNDVLSPGTPDPSPSLFDSLYGGSGDDTLALPGRPEDYGFSPGAVPGQDVVQSNPGVVPAGEARATLTDIEAVAFGVSALDIANGAVPLTTVALADLRDGSSNNGNGGRPHWSLSDSVSALFASNLVLIDIGTLLANDFDPDGGSLTLVDFLPTAPIGGPGMTFNVLLDAAAIDAAGYDSSLYPEGLLEVTLTQPLVAPVSFTYRTLASENLGAEDLGSIATVTINPVLAQDDVIRGTYGGETFIPYAALLANDGPGAVWGGLFNEFILGPGSIVDDPVRGGIVVTWPEPFGTTAFLEYSLDGVPGTAQVEVEIDNGPPVAVPLARVVTPGSTVTITFDEIVGHFGHFDPNLDGVVMGRILGGMGTGASFTVTDTGVDLSFDAAYGGGFALGFTLRDMSLGAESPASTISFLTVAPPAPVAVADTLEWGLGDGRSIFEGSLPGYGIVWSRELLANDIFMPGTVRLWNVPFDLTPDDGFPLPDQDSQLVRVLERPIPGFFGVTDPTDNGFGVEFVAGFANRSDTFVYTIVDPLGRQAQGQVTFVVDVPQPVLQNHVIVVAPGTTSLTLSASDILSNDIFTGAGAIAEVQGFGVGSIQDSGVDIGGGRTRIDGFTVTFDPAQQLSSYTLNILTFDTAAAGGSANGRQTVTFTAGAAAPPAIAFRNLDASSTSEGTAGGAPGGQLLFVLDRTGDLSAATSVTVTLGGTASAADILTVGVPNGGSLAPVAGEPGRYVLTFNPGAGSLEFEILPANDATPEPDETVTVTLDAATGGTLPPVGQRTATGTITDDDAPPPPPPAIAFRSLDAGSTPEGTTGSAPGGQLLFVLDRTGDLSVATSVTVTLGGTASAADILTVGVPNGGSLAPVAGEPGRYVLTFNPGAGSLEFEILPANDATPEPDETVTVTLDAATGGTLPPVGQRTATGTITDDDAPPPPPEIAFAAADVGSTPEGNGVDGRLLFVLTRTGDLSQASTVLIEVTGDATSGGIYVLGAGFAAPGGPGSLGLFEVNFQPGATEAEVEVFAGSDSTVEPDQEVVVAITSILSNGTISPTGAAVARGTILNDDGGNQPPDGIALSDLRVAPYLPPGALVAQISATDSDAGDILALSFAPGGNPRGFFAIDGGMLELARPLPFTNGALLPVTLRATDLSGATYDEAFVIEVGRDRSGTAAGERLGGRNSDDRLRGLGGDDELLGRDGDDLLEGGDGDDSMAGGTGQDTLHGDAGNDRLVGGAGNDSITGGTGRDTISAGEGADTVAGGGDAGTAVLRGPPGQQRAVLIDPDYMDLRRPGTLLPDADADLLLYAAGSDGVDLVRGFEAGRDAIRVTLNGDSLAVREVTNGTWIGFASDPGGVLLLGATGLVLGTDILIG